MKTGRRRRGYTLVFFAMLLFGIMAMAALVIDIGFARLTQRQMQTAADSAALEGLRGDDSLPYADRRDAARDFVHWHFDDDLDSTGTYPADDDGAFDTGSGQFGAGPLVAFSGGAGDPSLVAGQLMEVDPSNPVYKPQVLDGTPYEADTPQDRRFQVALRRGPTDAPDADLYANGPSVPYLFARGSLISRQVIADGITVRGWGQARSANALSIGLANDSITPPLPGLAPLALELSYWNGLATDSADDQAIAAGEIGMVGRFFAIETASTMPLTVGRIVPETSIPDDGTYIGFVPIYAALTATSTQRVVGFGEVHVTVSGTGTMATITRQHSRVGAENVSAVQCYSADLSGVEAVEVYSLVLDVEEPLMAPVSRSVDP